MVDREDLVYAARRARRAGLAAYNSRQDFYLRMQELERALQVPLPPPDGPSKLFDDTADLFACAQSVISEDGLVARLDRLAQERAEETGLYARAASYLWRVLQALQEDAQDAHSGSTQSEA